MKLYELTVIFDSTLDDSSVQAEIDKIQKIITDDKGKVVKIDRWGMRKLAYPIDNQKRGLYVHTLFNAAPDKIDHIERDVNLSETLLRVLITKGDHLGEVEIEQIKQGFIAAPTEEAGEAKEPASAQAAAE